MSTERKTSFSRWLEILQQESWQLELLISGFAIFLLAEAYGPIHHLGYRIGLLSSGSNYYAVLYVPYQVLLGAWYVLMINLVMHVLLRGLWISTIGLRYISGDIEFEKLHFARRFHNFLTRRIKSFDLYIQRLERLCSIVFGFTFLIIFILISLGLYSVGIFALIWLIEGINAAFGGSWFMLVLPVLLLYLLGGLIYGLDFISLGWVKKRKRLSPFYYPIYRFFSIITMSNIYRPIYYNLIDHIYGRKVVLFLIPYLLLFSIFASLRMETEAYLPASQNNESLYNYAYDESWNEEIPTYSASIPSKFVENGFLELYLPYIPRSDDMVIKYLCPDLQPAQRGIYIFGQEDPKRYMMDAAKAIDCHSQRFKIYIDDSLHLNPTYKFYEHPLRKNVGLLSIFNVSYLERGEHDVSVVVLLSVEENSDSLAFRETIRIPFWKE